MLSTDSIFLKSSIDESINSLVSEIEKFSQNHSSLFLQKKREGFVANTTYQHVFGFKPKNNLEKTMYALILEHLYLSENYSPGSFSCFFKCLKHHLIFKSEQKFENLISIKSRKTSKKEFEKHIQISLGIDLNSCNFLIAKEAMSLSGYNGKIVIEKSINDNDSIELIRGYTFHIKPAWNISCKLENPKIILIDGFIESVSEIHHLLNYFYEDKNTGVIYSRGFSNEVLSTLKLNWDRGSLKLLPILVPFDLNGINTMNDIAVIAGCDVISSTKGNLISSIDYKSITHVKEIEVSHDRFCIKNTSTNQNVINHLKFLNEKRKISEINSDISSFYDERIRTMSPNHIIIRLKDDFNFVNRAQELDLIFRTMKHFSNFGKSEEMDKLVDFFAKKCANQISSIGAIIIP